MITISQRLVYLLDKKGITIYILSERTGIAQSTLGRVKNKNAKPNKKNRKILADFFGVTVEWLIYGEETSKLEFDASMNDGFELTEKNNLKYLNLPYGNKIALIPYVDSYRVDGFLKYPDLTSVLPHYPYYTSKLISEQLIAFKMTDDSMESNHKNSIKRDAVLICNEINSNQWKTEALFCVSLYFVIVINGLILVRCVSYKKNKDQLTLTANNKDFKDIVLPMKDVSKIYKVNDIIYSF
jgi:transcriptional regulator with XRE-family HTH domain